MSGDSWSQRLPLPGRGTFPLKADFDVGIDKGPQSRYGGDDFEVNGQIDRNCSVIRGESWLVALVSQLTWSVENKNIQMFTAASGIGASSARLSHGRPPKIGRTLKRGEWRCDAHGGGSDPTPWKTLARLLFRA